MNLNTIRDFIENQHYRSKDMIMTDLRFIEHNCREFNSPESKLTEDSHKVHENMKKIIERAMTYKLRNLPTREASSRIRGTSNGSDTIDNQLNKRNPKKMPNKRARSTKKIEYIDDSEEIKLETPFKKPTPQKGGKLLDDSENTETDFKINLNQSSRSLRRSNRNHSNVNYSEEVVTPSNLQGKRQTRRRETKAALKASEGLSDLSNPLVEPSRSRRARPKSFKVDSECTPKGSGLSEDEEFCDEY